MKPKSYKENAWDFNIPLWLMTIMQHAESSLNGRRIKLQV